MTTKTKEGFYIKKLIFQTRMQPFKKKIIDRRSKPQKPTISKGGLSVHLKKCHFSAAVLENKCNTIIYTEKFIKPDESLDKSHTSRN